LKMVFNVKVTIPQLMALMSYFDKENTGSINCEKFLVQFVRTGMEEREKMNLAWKQKKKNKIERDLQKKQAIEMEKVNAMNQLKTQVANLTVDLAEKILRKKMEDRSQQEVFVNDSLKNITLN
jgi:hypothetical protein